jgi:hypothetical protein
MYAIVQIPILDKPTLQWQIANVIWMWKFNYVDLPKTKWFIITIYANEKIKNSHTHISHITC